MVISTSALESFLGAHGAEIDQLRTQGVSLAGAFPEGGPLTDKSLLALNTSAVESVGLELLASALSQGVLRALGAPVLIDVSAAARAFEALGRPETAEGLREAFLRARVRLQGTDGVRGPVCLDREGDAVLHFGRKGQVTPALIEILCFSFARLARKAGVVRRGGEVVIAEDGRDRATGGRLAAAMKDGFKAAGLTVIDLGVAPTPAVPFGLARRGVRLGASLTASHNPASQNGVKFFVDGFKMLPEGPVGDFAVSATACEVAWRGDFRREEGSLVEGGELLDEFAEFIVGNLPEGAAEQLSGLDIVFDGANGAFIETARKVFSALSLTVEMINDDPQGHNINQGGGVAEIEGARRITAAEAGGSPALGSVARMIERSNQTGRDVYGVVLDGDGDRAFIVVAEAGAGEALVVDGDAEAYIIARHFVESGRAAGEGGEAGEFIGTVESDLELFRAVRENLNLPTRIECVGDKWLVKGFREGLPLCLGQEVSGHILWPSQTQAADGARTVVTGNGLQTALTALVAARRFGLDCRAFARPFEPGTFVTKYTYNVDKAVFFKGSRAWQADIKAVREALDSLTGAEITDFGIVERPEEPDMLYIALRDGRKDTIGAVFARNSGTENKTGVYGRGPKSLEHVLQSICLRLSALHRDALKDEESREFGVERAVLEALEAGPLDEDSLSGAVEAGLGRDVEKGAFESVLFGMRKEGLIDFAEGRVKRTG
ncbi:MAG: hypothetical protein ACYTAN_13295 [Planctomycetota bacterium]|jgi:phosphoglucosamine mutase